MEILDQKIENKNFKLDIIAVDIDGTITYKNRELHEDALKAIRYSESQGVPVMLVSGETLQYCLAVSTLIGTSGPIVSEDGGVISDSRGNTRFILYDLQSVKKDIWQKIKEAFPNAKMTNSTKFGERHSEIALRETIVDDDLREFFRRENINLKVVNSGYALHIKPYFINKGNGIIEASKIYGLNPNNIAYIGDGSNDLSAFDVVHFSVALGNAPNLVKENADYVSESYGGGCGKAIYYLLDNFK